jgi:hypothetical protein
MTGVLTRETLRSALWEVLADTPVSPVFRKQVDDQLAKLGEDHAAVHAAATRMVKLTVLFISASKGRLLEERLGAMTG